MPKFIAQLPPYKRSRKITPEIRAVIHASRDAGQSDRAIARATGLSHTCIAYALDPDKAPWRRHSAKKRGAP